MNRLGKYLGARPFSRYVSQRREDRHTKLLILAGEARKHAAKRMRIAAAPDAAAWLASSGGYGSRDAYIATARHYLTKAFIERTGDRRRLP